MPQWLKPWPTLDAASRLDQNWLVVMQKSRKSMPEVLRCSMQLRLAVLAKHRATSQRPGSRENVKTVQATARLELLVERLPWSVLRLETRAATQLAALDLCSNVPPGGSWWCVPASFSCSNSSCQRWLTCLDSRPARQQPMLPL